MTTTKADPAVQVRQSAWELYLASSGLPAPTPTDNEIATVIFTALSPSIGVGVFSNPAVQAGLHVAAQAVRTLFPITKDSD